MPRDRVLSARMTALWIGFAGLLLLMAVLALDSGRLLRNVASSSAATRRLSRDRDALLDQLRTDSYHSGTVIRDYLMELDDSRASSYKDELDRVRLRIDDTLAAYTRKSPDSEKAVLKGLKEYIDSYWKSLAPSLEWSAAVRRVQGEGFLRDVVIPRRAEIVQLARQVTELNERDLDRAEESLQNQQAQFHRRVSVISILALCLGGILAGVIIRRVQRLEAEAEARYREVGELSNRLVTAQEEERRNLSRELHDEIGQAMSAMLVELGRLEAAPPDNEARRERLASVRRMAEESVGMVRNKALLLRPSMLDDLGLIPALKWQAREVTRRTGLRVKMLAEEITEDLDDSHRTCIYRVVQEALNNCAKHSRATQVKVIVRRDRDGLFASVQDDGVGFDPKQEKGLGMLGMEERVERLGGRFAVDSQPGHGAVLSVHFPLRNVA